MEIIVNGEKIEQFIFPGGECHVGINASKITDKTEILAKLTNSDSIMSLLMTVDAVRQVNENTIIDLCIPYFPYARQDRVCNEGEAFSLKVMAGLINSLNCNSVSVYDPHSKIAVDSINNCKVVSMSEIVKDSVLSYIVKEDDMLVVSPDKGAEKKVAALAEELKSEVIFGKKVRDLKTGKITHTEIEGEVEGRNCIIFDDICDGGRTFIELAKILNKNGAKNIILYVTHGIFSKGLGGLKEHFGHVYCHQTFLSPEDRESRFLTVLGD